MKPKKPFANERIINQFRTLPDTPLHRGVFVFPTSHHGYPLAFCLAVCQYIDMFCINCFYPSTQVANSRPNKKQPLVWRRRHCVKCGATFTTTERPSLAHNQLISNASGEAPFNLGKLIVSLSRAFQHDVTRIDNDVLELALTIQTELATELKIISSDDIAAVAHQVLKRYDELAAVQYAAQHQLIASTRRRGRPALRERERPTDGSPSR
jgi:transcriptional repressor NrdR